MAILERGSVHREGLAFDIPQTLIAYQQDDLQGTIRGLVAGRDNLVIRRAR